VNWFLTPKVLPEARIYHNSQQPSQGSYENEDDCAPQLLSNSSHLFSLFHQPIGLRWTTRPTWAPILLLALAVRREQ
jgi:hypothetical protein